MEGSFKIGRLFGIPVLIHFTFLLIIPLFAWIIGTDINYTVQKLNEVLRINIDNTLIISGFVPYLLGIIITLGLFACVFIHELSHSLVAKRAGIKIESITLLFFGGIASIEEREPEPKTELIMSLAGPLVSLAIGLFSVSLSYLSAIFITPPPVAGLMMYIFGYLGILNILLFAFNLLPAFPMDGGRVLRAYLAGRMPLHKATSIASSIGKGFAVIFGLIGLWAFSPLLILIAFFIYIGAGQETAITRYNFLLKDVTVRDIMSHSPVTVSPVMSLRDVMNQMYETKHLGFPVIDHGILAGIVTLTDIARTPVIDREAMQVRDVMTREVITISPDTQVTEALKIMSHSNIGRIPVIESDSLIGIITKSDIFTVIELREL